MWDAVICAGSRTDRLSAEDLGGIRFIGLDISEVAVQTNRWDFPGLEFEKYDLSRDPLPRRVDLVLCFDVLIHQTSHEQFTQCLNHLRRACGLPIPVAHPLHAAANRNASIQWPRLSHGCLRVYGERCVGLRRQSHLGTGTHRRNL